MNVDTSKENTDESGTLIKFGKLEHLLRLQSEGLLFLNNLPYFWNIEDHELRGDPFDCVTHVIGGPKITIPDKNGKEIIVCRDYTGRIELRDPEKINIFCMYRLRPFDGSFPVDNRVSGFGDHALVLTNPEEFIRQISLTLKSENIRAEADAVEYVDDEHIGKLGPFRKFKKFGYQYEWRLVCYDGPGKHRKIQIGNIKDISVITHSHEINKKMQIIFESDASADCQGMAPVSR